jgi:hypothetical protein
MEGMGGYFMDEKAVRVETIFLDFLKRFVLLPPENLFVCGLFLLIMEWIG